jgi:hypothetical protein
MKIYSVEKPIEFEEYDTFSRHIIVANNKEEAIQVAQSEAYNERRELWSYSVVIEYGVYTGPQTQPFIILSDFLKG